MRRSLVFFSLLFSCAESFAAASSLSQSDLMAKLVHGCNPVDLQTWRHPTRNVLNSEGVKLLSLQLCNDGSYPVFTVNFKYDPETDTDSYFNPLYMKMAKANGYWPFSFIDQEDNVIANVSIDKTHKIQVDYEQF